MNKVRLRTVVAAMAIAGGVTVSAVPAAGASTGTAPVPSATVIAGGVPSHCFRPGTEWRVAQSGISIRAFPGGPSLGRIPKGAIFLSRGPGNRIGVTCLSLARPDGTTWAYGVARASRIHGWIGLRWLRQIGRGPGF